MISRLLILSFVTGIFTGIFILFYAIFTKTLSSLLFFGDPMQTIQTLPHWYIYLVTISSIYIVNYIIRKNDKIKEYGVKEIALAVEKNGIVFSLKDLLLKIFVSALSLASGFAVGNEGPSAAIGAMIAHKFHNLFKLPKHLVKVALSVGASSGIAAIFVSPITGIMFAIENIAYEFLKNYAGYLITSSFLAFSIASYFLDSLVFGYESINKRLDYYYLVSSFLFIPIITLFIYLYLLLKDKILYILKNKIQPHILKYEDIIISIVSGSIIATILIINPYAAFSGHEIVKILIDDNFHLPLNMIFIIILLRIIATVVSLYANAVGGIFIALMSIGALIGYGFAELSNELLTWQVEPFFFAAIGAAVFMGVLMRLPLTAIVLALEITYDYNVVIPTGLIVVVVTYLVTLNFNLKKLVLKER
jgi:CIC family chloride channel protein